MRDRPSRPRTLTIGRFIDSCHSGADACLLSTQAAGGFVGALTGLHARFGP
jgi:hypothetical protein